MLAAIPIAERVELSRPRWVRACGPGPASLVIAGAGALSFAVAIWLRLDAPWLQIFACPIRSATGIPCLGCGATHAFVDLAHGRILAALLANPLWTIVAASGWIYALFTAARFSGLRWTLAMPTFSTLALRRVRILAFIIAAANWSFVALHR